MESQSQPPPKGILKADQLLPVIELILKNELKKMKLEEYLEKIKGFQDKISFVEKLEKYKIVEDINQLKINQSNQQGTHQANIVEIKTSLYNFLERQKQVQQTEKQIMSNDIELCKREQIAIILEQERIKEDHQAVKRELDSSRAERGTIRRNQEIMQEANNVDQVLLKLEHDKLKEEQEVIKADLIESKNLWRKMIQIHENILSERSKLEDDMKTVKSLQDSLRKEHENGMKLLADKMTEDRMTMMKERETLNREQESLKEEQERTKILLQQLFEDQEKLRKECERLEKERKKMRMERLRKEQQRIKEDKKKIQLELEKIEMDKKVMKQDLAKIKDEREQFLSIIKQMKVPYTFNNNDNMPPLSSSSASTSSNLLSIEYPEGGENDSLENVTFHYDDADMKYEEYEDDEMEDGSYLTLPLISENCSSSETNGPVVYDLEDYDDDDANETTEEETEEDEAEVKNPKISTKSKSSTTSTILPYNNREDLD